MSDSSVQERCSFVFFCFAPLSCYEYVFFLFLFLFFSSSSSVLLQSVWRFGVDADIHRRSDDRVTVRTVLRELHYVASRIAEEPFVSSLYVSERHDLMPTLGN